MMAQATKQHGATLIGTLIGVVLSLLVIGAMMMMHRTLALTSSQANQELVRDGQVMSSIQNVLTDLQQAGYGIEPGEPGQNLWASNDGKRVSWRYRRVLGQAGYHCGGLWVVGSPAPEGAPSPGLYLLRDVPCVSAEQASLWEATFSFAPPVGLGAFVL